MRASFSYRVKRFFRRVSLQLLTAESSSVPLVVVDRCCKARRRIETSNFGGFPENVVSTPPLASCHFRLAMDTAIGSWHNENQESGDEELSRATAGANL
jgi:hypothetical protein